MAQKSCFITLYEQYAAVTLCSKNTLCKHHLANQATEDGTITASDVTVGWKRNRTAQISAFFIPSGALPRSDVTLMPCMAQTVLQQMSSGYMFVHSFVPMRLRFKGNYRRYTGTL